MNQNSCVKKLQVKLCGIFTVLYRNVGATPENELYSLRCVGHGLCMCKIVVTIMMTCPRLRLACDRRGGICIAPNVVARSLQRVDIVLGSADSSHTIIAGRQYPTEARRSMCCECISSSTCGQTQCLRQRPGFCNMSERLKERVVVNQLMHLRNLAHAQTSPGKVYMVFRREATGNNLRSFLLLLDFVQGV